MESPQWISSLWASRFIMLSSSQAVNWWGKEGSTHRKILEMPEDWNRDSAAGAFDAAVQLWRLLAVWPSKSYPTSLDLGTEWGGGGGWSRVDCKKTITVLYSPFAMAFTVLPITKDARFPSFPESGLRYLPSNTWSAYTHRHTHTYN